MKEIEYNILIGFQNNNRVGWEPDIVLNKLRKKYPRSDLIQAFNGLKKVQYILEVAKTGKYHTSEDGDKAILIYKQENQEFLKNQELDHGSKEAQIWIKKYWWLPVVVGALVGAITGSILTYLLMR